MVHSRLSASATTLCRSRITNVLPPEIPRSTSRPLFAALCLALLSFAFPAEAAPREASLFINSQPFSSTSEYKGKAEITIVPPFDDARLSVSIDGNQVARNLGRPYRVELDLGPVAVEHTIRISAALTGGGKRHSWQEILNPGSRPLAVKIIADDFDNRIYQASVTVPKNDPVAAVEFYDDMGLLRRFVAPPYRLQVPERSIASVIRVTVKTRSGIEATDMIAGTENIHGQSYDVRTVQLVVSVTDRNGMVRPGLDPSNFEIVDNGTKAKILDVASAQSQPIAIALLLDASASMTHVMNHVTTEASKFAKTILRPQDQCSVYAIRTVPRREQPLTSDLGLVEKSLLGLEPSGNTALYDAIRTSLRELEEIEGRKAIVLLTDGEDTTSVSSHQQILEQARIAAVPIYVIAFNETQQFAAARDRLAFLATETGGFLISATAKDLSKKYAAIEQDLRAQYAIKYQVTDLAQPNEWRPVAVRVRAPELSARTIRGYFTP